MLQLPHQCGCWIGRRRLEAMERREEREREREREREGGGGGGGGKAV